jgi:hypothetical protein
VGRPLSRPHTSSARAGEPFICTRLPATELNQTLPCDAIDSNPESRSAFRLFLRPLRSLAVHLLALVARAGRVTTGERHPVAKTVAAACDMDPSAAMRNASSRSSLVDPDDFDAAAEPPPPDQRGPAAVLRRPLAQRALAVRGGRPRQLGRRRDDDGELRERMYSPGGGLRSLCGTPASSTWLSFEPHPLVGEAWDALRRPLLSFRGQPLGTIAAVDHAAGEVLNYDHVRSARQRRVVVGLAQS